MGAGGSLTRMAVLRVSTDFDPVLLCSFLSVYVCGIHITSTRWGGCGGGGMGWGRETESLSQSVSP